MVKTYPHPLPKGGLFLCLLLLLSCGGVRTDKSAEHGDTIPMRYARNLTMVRYADRTEVTIRNPWDTTAVLHRYILMPQDPPRPSLKRREKRPSPTSPLKGEASSLPRREGRGGSSSLPSPSERGQGGEVVHVPLTRAGVFTSVHCGLIEELGCREAIRGICEIQYINLPYVQEGVRTGRIANFGSAMEPTIEVIMDAEPDALLISPFENSGGYGRVERLGIPIIECADYMEYSPLARAEWMKFCSSACPNVPTVSSAKWSIAILPFANRPHGLRTAPR